MGCEITLKVLAEGLLFTPKALVKDISGVLDIFIFGVSLIWLCWMPTQVEPNSLAQLLMLLRYLNIYFIDDGCDLYYFVIYKISNKIFLSMIDLKSYWQMLSTFANPYSCTPYEARRSRAVQRIQGNSSCIRTSACSHLRIRHLGFAFVWDEVCSMQRSHYNQKRRLCWYI